MVPGERIERSLIGSEPIVLPLNEAGMAGSGRIERPKRAVQKTRKTGRVRAAVRLAGSCILWRRGTAPFALEKLVSCH
jgi:hypothetical protein